MKDHLIAELDKHINPERIEATAHFFGICPDGYGEGDVLLGIPVPTARKIALEYKDMPENEIVELLHSKVHEHRFAALEILVAQYKKSPERSRRILLENIEAANNWDLIDVITWKILGMWALEHHDERIFHEFAKSDSLWKRRIAVVSYMAFYRHGVLGDGPDIIEQLLSDKEPLIHKACGWMLREIYWRVDKHFVESFIIDHYSQMSRTTLRYAIERMPEPQRKQFLKGEF
ncbi:DNA alkylation repair protein [Candidatus Saccharibacteria bacterium]|nr:DNA alkylation repair protein [Candidatus Saccharibacteria bacterium]